MAVKNTGPLRNWTVLNEYLPTVDKASVLKALLTEELNGKGRKGFVVRIHQRYNILRMLEERAEILYSLQLNRNAGSGKK